MDRVSSGIPSFNTFTAKFIEFLFPNYIWRFIKALRSLEYCENVILRNKSPLSIKWWGGVIYWLLVKYRFRKLSLKLGYSIPINVFDSGISLPHYGTIVVNPDARIGKNCRIHVGVNIGAHHDRAPQLGDNVYIGPGAIVFGEIEIADNVSIGANATVNKSVTESNTVVVGTPAHIVKRNVLSWNNVKK
ncbi:MAG: serine acetyltransferase [Bacteroides sp.]|nr:serine acetyltransferase [Bacteroides sp.]